MISIQEYKNKVIETHDEFPLLTLDEFFDGNSDEDAIAPNQRGEGRPKLDEIYAKFKLLEHHDNIAWIRVFLHDDTVIANVGKDEVLRLYGDSIIICTNLRCEEVELLADCEWLISDGADEIDLENYINTYPDIPEGFCCLEVMWD